MNQAHSRAETGERLAPFVIRQTEQGREVYSVADPATVNLVTGPADHLSCDCLHFTRDGDCVHVDAVHGKPSTGDSPEPTNKGAGDSRLLLKRSVSPDGRIDALSVELSCPVAGIPSSTIKANAKSMLELQSAIVATFLGRGQPKPQTDHQPGRMNRVPANGNQGQSPHGATSSRDDTYPAMLLGVGGVSTRWGRRLFLDVELEGRMVKFFGSKRQLGDELASAGYANVAPDLEEGLQLQLPVRVSTEPSRDGRYTNVKTLHPPGRNGV